MGWGEGGWGGGGHGCGRLRAAAPAGLTPPGLLLGQAPPRRTPGRAAPPGLHPPVVEHQRRDALQVRLGGGDAALVRAERAHRLVDGDVAAHAVNLQEGAELAAGRGAGGGRRAERCGRARQGGRSGGTEGGPRRGRGGPGAAGRAGTCGGAARGPPAMLRAPRTTPHHTMPHHTHLMRSFSSRDTCTFCSRSRAACSLARTASWSAATAVAGGGGGDGRQVGELGAGWQAGSRAGAAARPAGSCRRRRRRRPCRN